MKKIYIIHLMIFSVCYPGLVYSDNLLCRGLEDFDLSICQAVNTVKENRTCEKIKSNSLSYQTCRAITAITEGSSCENDGSLTEQESFICSQLYLGMNSWRIDHLRRSTPTSVVESPTAGEFRDVKKAFFQVGRILTDEFSFFKSRREKSIAHRYFDNIVDQMAVLTEINDNDKSKYNKDTGICGYKQELSTIEKTANRMMFTRQSTGVTLNLTGGRREAIQKYIEACEKNSDRGDKASEAQSFKIPEICRIDEENRDQVLNLAQNLFSSLSEVADKGMPSLAEIVSSAALIVNFLKAKEAKYLEAVRIKSDPVRLEAGGRSSMGNNKNFILPIPLVFLPNGQVMIQLSHYMSQGKLLQIQPLGKGSFKTVYSALDAKQALLPSESPKQKDKKFALTVYNLSEIEDEKRKKNLFQSITKEFEVHRQAASQVGKGIAEPLQLYHEGQNAKVVPKSLVLVQSAYEGDLIKLSKDVLSKNSQTLEGVGKDEIKLRIALELMEGLAASHKKGIHHRDIKPGNVFYYYDSKQMPHAVIADFGIALNTKKKDKLGTEKLSGTLKYMSPEFKKAFFEVQDQYKELGSLENRANSMKKVGKVLGNESLKSYSKEIDEKKRIIERDLSAANSNLKNDVNSMGMTLKSLWYGDGDSDGQGGVTQTLKATVVSSQSPTSPMHSSESESYNSTLDRKVLDKVFEQMIDENANTRLTAQESLNQFKSLLKNYNKSPQAQFRFLRGDLSSESALKSYKAMDLRQNQKEYQSDLDRLSNAIKFEIKSLDRELQ